MDDLIAIILIAFLVGLLLIVLLVYRLAFRELERRYAHSQKMATGNFKVQVSSKEWQEAMEKGALAVGVKDAKTGNVAFTILIERLDAKT
jgi:hypothetical protein